MPDTAFGFMVMAANTGAVHLLMVAGAGAIAIVVVVMMMVVLMFSAGTTAGTLAVIVFRHAHFSSLARLLSVPFLGSGFSLNLTCFFSP